MEGYRIGRGDIRRPDLVIPIDPSTPLSQANIESVVEFKFGNDRRDEKQDQAYIEIAGGDEEKYSIYRVGGPLRNKEQGCNCYDPMRSPEPVLLPQPASRKAGESNWARTASALGWTGLAAVGAAVTVLAVLSPFDGPVGDVVAGTATAAAAARAAAAWRTVAPVF